MSRLVILGADHGIEPEDRVYHLPAPAQHEHSGVARRTVDHAVTRPPDVVAEQTERGRILAAAAAAGRDYPGPLGAYLRDQLLTYEGYGYIYGANGANLTMKLVAYLIGPPVNTGASTSGPVRTGPATRSGGDR